MRRFSRILVGLLVLALALDWAPGIPPLPVHTAAAQPQVFPSSFGNQLWSFTASQQVVNTTSPAGIFAGILPPGYFATPPNTNIIGAGAPVPSGILQGPTAAIQTIGNVVGGMPIPVHVSLIGSLSYASGTIQLAANFGGGATGAATVALLNALTPTAANGNQGVGTAANPLMPIRIDCWLVPVATASGTLNSLGPLLLSCRTELTQVALTGAGNATASVYNVAGYAATGFQIASPQIMNIIWQWGSAASGNALVIHSATATLGW